ncbi:MAG: hypothetical protein IKK11_08380 [Oscillospiraceae bacterium]|nr:hypothetical protein [Oscillospiraceae bacterium]
MASIVNYFSSMNLDIGQFLKATGMLLAALIVLALLGRFIFGKRSALILAVSSAIGILFIYAITILLGGAGETLQKFIAPLPFVTIENDTMVLFNFQADYTVVCTQILSMIILAFMMNLADGWLPVGKNVFTWVFFRCLGVVIALVLHLVVTGLLTTYLPEGLITYAPTILLAILGLMLLTGALKFLVGLILTTVNPLIAALYTFFFANMVGKQVTKAILTTAILAGLVFALQKLGIVAISIASAALAAYIPLILLLVVLWYIIGKLL